MRSLARRFEGWRFTGRVREIGSEAKQREVLQLLKDYRPWHSAFGGSMPLDETGVVDASYGPAGMVLAGAQFDDRDLKLLAQSYEDLENALTVLRADGHQGMTCYLMLLSPYLGDPGDPSIVSAWREKKPGAAEWHDLAVEKLAGYLCHKDLHVVWPKRMTSRQEKQVDRMNDELFGLYKNFRYGDGMSRNKAIEKAAEHCGYGRSRGYEIVEVREGKAG